MPPSSGRSTPSMASEEDEREERAERLSADAPPTNDYEVNTQAEVLYIYTPSWMWLTDLVDIVSTDFGITLTMLYIHLPCCFLVVSLSPQVASRVTEQSDGQRFGDIEVLSPAHVNIVNIALIMNDIMYLPHPQAYSATV